MYFASLDTCQHHTRRERRLCDWTIIANACCKLAATLGAFALQHIAILQLAPRHNAQHDHVLALRWHVIFLRSDLLACSLLSTRTRAVSPTSRITPVAVPLLIIHAPVNRYILRFISNDFGIWVVSFVDTYCRISHTFSAGHFRECLLERFSQSVSLILTFRRSEQLRATGHRYD